MPRQLLRLLLIAWLLVVTGPALALGLGRIEVKSQHGQPLLAEIPVVSSDPAELRALQARLASPDTFARIGLDPPQGLVSDLQFNVALDASGRPVIRVTSLAPVQQEALTFLVEVDWGQGRLVREYSALIAVPDTVAAPTQPAVQAPVVAAPATIVRAPAPAMAASTPAPAAAPAAERPVNDDTAVAPTPTPAPAAAPAPVAASAAPSPASPAVAASLPPVERGQTLSALAAPLAEQGDISVNQAMLLLLRANPDAFISGNLNLIKQGAVLRVPPQSTWSQYSNAEAAAVVREQVGQWREMRRPAPQPDVSIAAQDAAAAPETPAVTAATTPARTASGARLEITPPAADGQQAGTQSGIDAGGGGDMLRQELQQANESVAARTAEIDELKARLADLEQLQQQQSQLIEMKDAELAAAQQRMADSNNAQTPAAAGGFPWIWLGLALLVVGLLAFLLGRRGAKPAAPPVRSAGFASAKPVDTASDDRGSDAAAAGPALTFAATTRDVPPTVEAAAASAAAPAWHAGDASGYAATEAAPAPAPSIDTVESTAPAAPGESIDAGDSWAPPIPDVVDVAPHVADAQGMDLRPDDAGSVGVERIELARAYIELGDTATARSLLQEVVDGADATASADAATLLRTLA